MVLHQLWWVIAFLHSGQQAEPASRAVAQEVRFLAVGDVNIGRRVGQHIVRGDTLYPFVAVIDTFRAYDVVFANLESNLSDQKGETEHPGNNLVFTGPPAGAQSLFRAGVTMVSTANNHALDYGTGAHGQTMDLLSEAGVRFAGTATDSARLYQPAIVERNGIRIGLFAVTDVMNAPGSHWRTLVAAADTGVLFPRLRAYRDSVDVVLLSYHGGEEYVDTPSGKVLRFARAAVEAGVDVFLGHHPHVPQRVESTGGSWIVYSLGNFVFQQPSRYWTQHSMAFACVFRKQGGRTRIADVRILPVRCGFQPAFLPSGPDAERILARVGSDRSVTTQETGSW